MLEQTRITGKDSERENEEYMEEEEMKAWNAIKEGITTLEENGNWIKEEMRIEKRKEVTVANDRMPKEEDELEEELKL